MQAVECMSTADCRPGQNTDKKIVKSGWCLCPVSGVWSNKKRFSSLLDGMLVCHRASPSIKVLCPLCTWVERVSVRVKSFTQKHVTMSLARVQPWTTWSSWVKHTNHGATVPLVNWRHRFISLTTCETYGYCLTIHEKYVVRKGNSQNVLTNISFCSGFYPEEFAVPSQEKPKHGFIGRLKAIILLFCIIIVKKLWLYTR